MSRTVLMRAVLLFAVLINIGCGNDTPSFSLLADTDEFKQAVGVQNTKIDILWVIDNSGSMQTSQQNLADNFQSFIGEFQNKNYDYQIGVVTTDAYKEFYTGNSDYSKLRDGVGSNHTNEFILNPDTEDLTDKFMTNILQGIKGSGDERAFQSLEAALSNPFNASFLRPDAFLAVIIVSDEDDFSRNHSAWKEDYNDPLAYSIQHYVNLLDGIKNPGSTDRKYSVSAMAVWDQACLDELIWAKKGQRYGELVDATGGTKGDLCGSFSNELDFIANNIIQLATKFYLSREPIPGTLTIAIDGVQVPKSGWTYDPETNSVTFHGEYIPAEGAKIDVNYDPLHYEDPT